MPLVQYEVGSNGAVATITLDSQHNRNALSAQLLAELKQALATASYDADIKAVLLKSSGRVFCSGADLAEVTGWREQTLWLFGTPRQ